jgi:deoxyribose-phosphate aldolase
MNINNLIDHTLLRPDASELDIENLCNNAEIHGFYSVCIQPAFIRKAKQTLSQSHVKISTVIGFPTGMTLSRVKIYEAMEAVLNGADELDIVVNIGFIKSGKWNSVAEEISDILTATPGAVHKIIIETCYLSDAEKSKASEIAMDRGAEFIKTSTGFGPAGASVKDVKLIRSVTKGKIGIKAAGGVRTLKDAMAHIDAGATRIGTSSGVEIMKEASKKK